MTLAFEPPSFRLDGKVAVVTGAVGLLGRRHAATLASAGAGVVVTDQEEPVVTAFAEELASRFDVPTLGVPADVSSPEEVDSLRARVFERFGRLDVLVNNAAIDDKFTANGAAESRFESYPLVRFRRLLEVNVLGVFLCCQRLGAEMARRRSGSIVNVASTYAIVAPDQRLYEPPEGEQSFFKGPAYPASKAAVLSLTRFLASYWGPSGVRVNALSPGGVRAGQAEHFQRAYASRTPLRRMAEARDFEGALLFLASEASAYVTGENLVVDGGFTAW